MKPAFYKDSVFINCPFDEQYTPILQAIIYVVCRCGFSPITALDEDNGAENRLQKIIRMIENCRYGIHDLSRTESDNGFPRFNMPFELGIFFGAKYIGTYKQKTKNALILERKKYSSKKFISDINGIDPKSHENKPLIAIEKVRDWLEMASARTTIPNYNEIKKEYLEFKKHLSSIIKNTGFTTNNIPFQRFRIVIEETVQEQIHSNKKKK